MQIINKAECEDSGDYYDENFLPPKSKSSRRDLTSYQPNSGTAVAYMYAVKKQKKIINIFLPLCY